MNEQTAIHAMGNGSFLIYGKGPNLVNLHAGDYSSPSIASLVCEDASDSHTDRAPRSCGWNHTVYNGDQEMTFWDMLDPEYNVFRRIVRSHYYTTLKLQVHPDAKMYRWEQYDFGPEKRDCVCLVLPKGTVYFTGVATSEEYRLFILCGGCVSMDPEKPEIRVSPGEGGILMVAGRAQETPVHLEAALSPIDIGGRSLEFWQKYLDRITAHTPDNPRLEAAIESVAIHIKAQQSRDGGVTAGHFYPMAYVRDQAGTARGLLRLGLTAEAKAIVEFWNRKFQLYGDLYNAETMGNDDGRLKFSNDEVEVPAYVMLTAFACAEKEGGLDYLLPLKPMLSWAAHAQTKHLAHGMTGFSGDETYIAGGMFPRVFLYHGSAESTMLYILSVEKYVELFGDEDDLAARAAEAKSLFRENFVADGQLMANNPIREKIMPPPRFHFGWCDSCILTHGPGALTWLERSEDGLYRCTNCRGKKVENIPEARPYHLGSASLLPAWHGFDLITDNEMAATVKPFLDAFHRTGEVSSMLDGDAALGYDYALLLTTLTHLRHPDTSAVLERTLDRLDEAGAWSEYYKNGVAYNCRCRPWESGINLAAAIDAEESLR